MITAQYAFGQLDPASSARSVANAPMLGPRTLGVEVTVPRLAESCGLGNLDPQHGGSGTALAAIEAALQWPLPPEGSTLVTVRADADALGAMAVLALRANAVELDDVALGRIAGIARWDKLDRGSWQAWRRNNPPLFRPARAVDLKGKALELKAVDALVRLPDWTMAERVVAMAAWICGQALPPTAAAAHALDFEASLLSAWNSAAIDVHPTPDARIALLLAQQAAPAGGMDLAYRLAPVVLAEKQLATGRKVTVAQFEAGWVDMAAILADLAAIEPGWGGTQTIIGSPQGGASRLTITQVYRVVASHLLR